MRAPGTTLPARASLLALALLWTLGGASALAQTPKDAEGWRKLGQSRLAAGENAKAVEAFAKAAQLKPEWVEAHLGLAEALSAMGNWNGALGSYRAAIKLGPKDPALLARLHHKAGLLLYNKEDLSEAAEEFQEALRADPLDYASMYFLGLCLDRQGDLPGAIFNLRRVSQKSVDYAAQAEAALSKALLRRGEELEQKRDAAGAASAYREALTLRKPDPEAASRAREALTRLSGKNKSVAPPPPERTEDRGAAAPPPEGARVGFSRSVTLLAEPKAGAKETGVLPPYAGAEVLATKEDWLQVRSEDMTGWAPADAAVRDTQGFVRTVWEEMLKKEVAHGDVVVKTEMLFDERGQSVFEVNVGERWGKLSLREREELAAGLYGVGARGVCVVFGKPACLERLYLYFYNPQGDMIGAVSPGAKVMLLPL